MTINTPEDSVVDYLAALLYEDAEGGASDTETPYEKEAEASSQIEKAPPKAPVTATGEAEKPLSKSGTSAQAAAQKPQISQGGLGETAPSAAKPERPEQPHAGNGQATGASPERLSQTLAESAHTSTDLAEVDRERLNRLLNSARPQLIVPTVDAPSQQAPKAPAHAGPTRAVDAKFPEAPGHGPEVPGQGLNEAIDAPRIDALRSPEGALLADTEWHENGRPTWAQERFDVLLFKVYGLTLAVPLVALGQIQPLTEELTPLFGQADWLMGLQPTPVGRIKTVNTALFVMPERYNPEFLETAKYVVSIHGLNWGLAVDSVQQPKSLSPEDVKWRTSRGQRPWLAGTIKAHMCALIDVANMGRMLASSDKNHRG